MKDNLDVHVPSYSSTNEYHFDNLLMINKYSDLVLQLAKPEWKVLDLGIGHGVTTNKFSQFFSDYTVLDGSHSIIEKFHADFPHVNAHIIETYFEEYETDQKYDLIILGFVLEHVDNPCAILEKYKKMLMPQGKMFIAVPNAETLNRRVGYYAGLLRDIKQLSANDNAFGHKRYFTVDDFKKDLARVGLISKKYFGLYLKPLTSKQLAILNLPHEVFEAFLKVGEEYPELSLGFLACAEIDDTATEKKEK